MELVTTYKLVDPKPRMLCVPPLKLSESQEQINFLIKIILEARAQGLPIFSRQLRLSLACYKKYCNPITLLLLM